MGLDKGDAIDRTAMLVGHPVPQEICQIAPESDISIESSYGKTVQELTRAAPIQSLMAHPQ